MHGWAERIDEAAASIRKHWAGKPRVGIVLGTGLGPLVDEIRTEAAIDYEQIANFARSTATGHHGRMVCGTLAGVNVMAMAGRFHAYEGYSYEQITLPVRVMKALGAELLIVTNACGGMNPQFATGDIMVIDDHINLMGSNPLVGINDDRLGPRFPDMCRPYDPELIEQALAIARRENFAAHKGVFVAVLGPNLETRAEYRFLRLIGADAVGMSTVPEVIVAVHCGLRVLGCSIVTDMCLPDALRPTDIAEIIATANAAEPKLRKIILGVLGQLPRSQEPVMLDQLPKVAAATDAIRARWPHVPHAALVLGSGMGELAGQIEIEQRLPYESIPHFPPTTAPGQAGALVCGTLAGVRVVVMDGRAHLYEGCSAHQASFGVRVAHALGCKVMILSNACGGINPNLRRGDIIVLEDHVNLTFANPLVGPHDPACGLGYPDLSCPYDRQLGEQAMAIARAHDFVAHRGVYLGVSGPNYETRAEYRFFRRIGADAVGMSTVCEAIVAAQLGLRLLALSVVTNECFSDRLEPASCERVIAVAAAAEPRVRMIIEGVLAQEAQVPSAGGAALK